MGIPIDLTERDPFTPIIKQLWAILEATPAFTSRVLEGNRIKFTQDMDPAKYGVLQPGWCPEVSIMPGNKPQDWAPQSGNIEIEPIFVITVLSGDMRVAFKDTESGLWTGANILEWIITRALCAAGETLGISYVTEARIVTGVTLDLGGAENRGHKGWSLMITVKVRLTLDRSGDVLTGQDEYINVPGQVYLPEITSAAAVTATQGQPFAYQITATQNPTQYAASDLPSGLTLNPATGLISGTVEESGQVVFIVSAINQFGVGSQEVTIIMGGGGGGGGTPYYSALIDLTQPGTYTIQLPTGFVFYPDMVGIVCDVYEEDEDPEQPTIQIGTPADPNLYAGPYQTTNLTSAPSRDYVTLDAPALNVWQKGPPPANYNQASANTIQVQVVEGAEGMNAMQGRFFVRGQLQ